jgi:hypothetical protein
MHPESDWTRPEPRKPRDLPSTGPLTIFYGVAPETIAKVCCVKLWTAKAYKTGIRKPSAQVVRLMQLHNARRILDESWRGWSAQGDYLFPPGQRTGLSRGRIEAYNFLMAILFDPG